MKIVMHITETVSYVHQPATPYVRNAMSTYRTVYGRYVRSVSDHQSVITKHSRGLRDVEAIAYCRPFVPAKYTLVSLHRGNFESVDFVCFVEMLKFR